MNNGKWIGIKELGKKLRGLMGVVKECLWNINELGI